MTSTIWEGFHQIQRNGAPLFDVDGFYLNFLQRVLAGPMLYGLCSCGVTSPPGLTREGVLKWHTNDHLERLP